MVEVSMNKIQLRQIMKQSNQTNTQTIYQHGVSVARFYTELRDHIRHGIPLQHEWKLPFW